MINKKYSKELDKIVPNDDDKKKLLLKIITKKNKHKSMLLYNSLGLVCVTIIMFIIFNINNEALKIKPIDYRNIEDKYVYNKETYCNIGIYNDSLSLLVEIDNISLKEKIYKINNSQNIVIYLNDVYAEYAICGED